MIILQSLVKVRRNTMDKYFYGMVQKHDQLLAKYVGKYVKLTLETDEVDK